jgi:hypothetical protein
LNFLLALRQIVLIFHSLNKYRDEKNRERPEESYYTCKDSITDHKARLHESPIKRENDHDRHIEGEALRQSAVQLERVW